MFKIFGAVLVALTFVGSSVAADLPTPKQSISGLDKSAIIGELVELGLTEPAVNPNLVSYQALWDVTEFRPASGNFVPVPFKACGKGILFAAGINPKKLYVTVVIDYMMAAQTPEKKTEVVSKCVLLKGILTITSSPFPGPTPEPPVPPVPLPVVDDPYEFIPFVAANFNVDAAYKVKSAAALSVAYKKICGMVTSGEIKNVDGSQAGEVAAIAKFLTEAKRASDASLTQLGVPLTALEPFGITLQDKLDGLYKAKTLSTLDGFVKSLNAIAIGLERIK